MFTGIVATQGRILSIVDAGGDLDIGIDAPGLDFGRIALGDSISVEGVCLTATRLAAHAFHADVSRETLSKTTLGQWIAGTPVNLELSLRAGDALGGHMVSGHVDAVGTLTHLETDARSRRLQFELPQGLMRYVAAKGSICVNGVSLTVNSVDARRFDVNIIPHTLEVTTLGRLSVGARVNIEIDVVARYLERLMAAPTERD